MESQTTLYQQLLCSVLETVINKALALSLNGTHGLYALEQKCLVVHLAELGFPLSFVVNNSKVLVASLSEHPDCEIHTSIKTLVALKKEQQLTELIKQDKLDIAGDIKVAQQFANIAETLDIDWQSELAKHIGDIPTYKLTQLSKQLAKKVGFAAKQIQADSTEWLVHEKRLVVTRSQVSAFNLQVSDLDVRAETLSEQFAKIEKMLDSASESKIDLNSTDSNNLNVNTTDLNNSKDSSE